MKKITYTCEDKLADEIMEIVTHLRDAVVNQEWLSLGDLATFDGSEYDAKKPGDLELK